MRLVSNSKTGEEYLEEDDRIAPDKTAPIEPIEKKVENLLETLIEKGIIE